MKRLLTVAIAAIIVLTLLLVRSCQVEEASSSFVKEQRHQFDSLERLFISTDAMLLASRRNRRMAEQRAEQADARILVLEDQPPRIRTIYRDRLSSVDTIENSLETLIQVHDENKDSLELVTIPGDTVRQVTEDPFKWFLKRHYMASYFHESYLNTDSINRELRIANVAQKDIIHTYKQDSATHSDRIHLRDEQLVVEGKLKDHYKGEAKKFKKQRNIAGGAGLLSIILSLLF